MIPYSLYNINLMQLEIFIRCAEHCNFSKAAAELQITTSMVSKKIAALENATGIILFIREKNHVRLTQAGHKLYGDVKQSVGLLTASVEQAAFVQQVENRPLVFNLFLSYNEEAYFVPLLNVFRSIDTKASFRISLESPEQSIEHLKTGHCDIIFLPKFLENELEKYDEFDWILARSSPLYVGICKESSLAKKDTVTMNDLRNFRFTMTEKEEGIEEAYCAMLTSLCSKYGFSPKWDRKIGSILEAYLNVTEDNVFIIDKYYYRFQSDSLFFKEIEDTESGILMIWHKNARATVQEFVDYAKHYFTKTAADQK